MKNRLNTFLFATLITLAACNSNTTEENNSVPGEETAIQPMTPGFSPLPDSGQTMTAPPPASAPTGAVAAGMNPQHGEPGHRCDIAVGAPLNSPPATPPSTGNITAPVTPQPTAAPTMVSPTLPMPGSPDVMPPPVVNTSSGLLKPTEIPAPGSVPRPTQPGTSTKTLPGMNPPHGEPGHDCGIAVGAPLKK